MPTLHPPLPSFPNAAAAAAAASSPLDHRTAVAGVATTTVRIPPQAAAKQPTKFALVVAYYAEDGMPAADELRRIEAGFTNQAVHDYFADVSYGKANLEITPVAPVAIRGIKAKYTFDKADAESLYSGGSYRLKNGVVVRPVY